MSQYGVLVAWREVAGTEATPTLLEERLAPFRLEAVLVGFSRLAAALRTWQNEPSFATDQRFARQFLPTYYPAIERLYGTGNRVTFTRISILFVLKHACAVCPDDGGDIRSPQDVEQLLSCCLLANDLLLARLPTPEDTAIDRAANLLPFSNYVPQDTYPTDLARNLLLIEEIAPQLATQSDYVDIAGAFRNATGLTARQFCELTLATSTKFVTNVDAQLQNANTAFLLTPAFYANTAVAAADVAAFFARLHTNPAELRDQVRRATLGSDFLLFQRHPLIEITEQRYVCPDPGFLLDKAGPGLYWTLHDATPAQQRGALLAYWSRLIERYVHWLFAETYQGRGRYQANPCFANGDEAGDALLLEGSTLLVFEVKASILTAKAKYGFSPETLKAELHQKAITGEDGERKGVAQVRHNLTRWLDGDDLPSIDRGTIRTVQPVLVFLDHAFTSPYLNKLYNEHFDSAQLRRRYRRTIITPLFSITLGDLENVLPYSNQHELRDILESYYRANKGMHGTISGAHVPLLRDAVPGKDVVRERFRTFADGLEQRFHSGAPDAASS